MENEEGGSGEPSSSGTQPQDSSGTQPQDSGGGPSAAKKSRTFSHYRDHFHLDVASKEYKCNYCTKASYQQSTGGITSNMKKHLRKYHKDKCGNLFEDDEVAIGPLDKYRTSNGLLQERLVYTEEKFRTALATFIVLLNLPFSIVEEKAFLNFLKIVNSAPTNFRLPVRNTVKSDIFELHKSKKEELKAMLKEHPGKLSFVIDGWTSSNQIPYLGVIVQFVTNDWTIYSSPLDLKILEGSHTGKNIAKAFFEILKDFEIEEKVYSITTDNASNMDTFFEELQALMKQEKVVNVLKPVDFRVRCLAHVLNLCCQDSLSALKVKDNTELTEDNDGRALPPLTKLHKAVTFIRSSPQRIKHFKDQCKVAKLGELGLIQDVATRWNSTYFMIERAIRLRKALDNTLRSEAKLSSWVLTDEDWTKLEYMMSYLKIFLDMTELMSSQKFPTISFCSLVYQQVFEHLETYMIDAKRNLKGIDPKTKKKYPEWIKDAATLAHAKLDKYYPDTDGLVYVLGTVLDPRCKLQIFQLAGFQHKVVTSYEKQAVAYWKSNYKPTTSECSSQVPSGRNPERDLFLKAKRKQSTPILDEFEKYLKEETVAELENGVLGWWKIRKCEYPNLSRMAMDCLSASGSGVPVERLFSCGPDLLSKKRQSLSAESIRKCICTRAWIRAEQQDNFLEDVCEVVAEKMSGGESLILDLELD